MSNFQVKDAAGTTQNFKASGSGDSGDPFVPEHNVAVTAALPAGDNNIGNVDVVSLPELPEGANTIGKINQGAGGDSAWKVDGSAVTQPISADSLPLPAGAATSAKQDTGNTSLASIDGKLTECDTGDVTVSASALPTGAATAANQTTIIGHVDGIEGLLTTIDADTSALAGAVSGSEMQVDIVGALPAGSNYLGKTRLTDGTNDVTLFGLTSANAVPVAIVNGDGEQITSFAGGSGGGTEYTEGASDSTITGQAVLWEDAGDTLRTVSADTPLPVAVVSGVDIGDVTINNGAGASAVNIQDGGNSITVDGSVSVSDGGGSLTVDGTVTANAGTGTFATNLAQVGGNTINTGTGNAGTGTARVVLASDQPNVSVTQKPATSGGLSVYRNLDTGSTGTNAKTSAGQLYGWYLFNAHATDIRYVKLYNKASAPTSSDTPAMTVPVPPLSGANVEFTNGIAFSSGIGIRATMGVADNNTGAPGTNDVIVNLLYS